MNTIDMLIFSTYEPRISLIGDTIVLKLKAC